MDVYRLLNVSRNATSVEIKQAYRKLALKFHPDLNPTRRTEAEEHFKKITVAYQTLIEHKKQTEAVDASTSASYSGMPPGFGNSTERHAHWDPKPSYQNNANNPNAKKKYDAEAAQKAYHANQRAQQQGSEPYINPDHFNVNMWRAGHYGSEDNSKISDNIKYKTSWASSGGKHQQYYARRNEAKRQQEAANAAKDEQVRHAYDAGHNLRKKREERLKNERNSSPSTANNTGDGEGNTKCTIS